jgi:hypothetical protein
MKKDRIRIPTITPRDYQLPFLQAMAGGCKRAVLRWARRHGKDEICLAWTSISVTKKVGTYWHLLPEKEQARKAIWLAVNPHTGKRRIDEAFPREIRSRTNDQEMFIEFKNGSTWQVLGSDRYDSLVGSPPVGVVFSEYALANPSAWDYISPMLLENGGWAVFNSTVRGMNHFWHIGEYAKNQSDWFFQQINANETNVFPADILEKERFRLIEQSGDDGLAVFRQEYFNDPNAAIPGAYYGKWMSAAMDEGRIGNVPHEHGLPVFTSWDLGINDDNVIWFIQKVGREFHAIDYYSNSNEGMAHYVKVIKDKPYIYEKHYLPHDGGHHEKGSGKTIKQTLAELGLKDLVVVARTPTLARQIDDVRIMLPKMWFDKKKCEKGIDCLVSYHREWDDKLKVFRDYPKHDWASHGASAFATFAQGYSPGYDISNFAAVANTEYNPFS